MKKAVNKVPTLAELNRMLARTAKEVDLFDKLDAQGDWPVIPTGKRSAAQACIILQILQFLQVPCLT